MPSARSFIVSLALAVPSGLVLAACGGEEETGSSAATAPAATTATSTATTSTEQREADAAAPASAASKADLPEFSGTLTDGSRFDQSMVQADTVIHVFASWCPTCKSEAPDFAKFQRENPDLNYLYVAVADEPADSEAFLAEYGFADGKIINDGDRSVASAFGLTGQPNTVFVPAEGELTKIIGPADADRLNEAAEQLS